MNKNIEPVDGLLRDLRERSKELNCLYRVEEILHNEELPMGSLFQELVQILPSGLQYPEIAQVKIIYKGMEYKSRDYEDSSCELTTPIVSQGKTLGEIICSYNQEVPQAVCTAFLKEEKKLIIAISDRVGYAILYRGLKDVFSEWQSLKKDTSKKKENEWKIILDMLNRADRNLYVYISQKMLHYLCWNGIVEARELLERNGSSNKTMSDSATDNSNQPIKKDNLEHIVQISDQIFKIASSYLTDKHILTSIQEWIEEDKSRFIVRALDNPNSSLDHIINSITRYRHISNAGAVLPASIEKGLRVSLIRYFFSDQLDFIKMAKNHIPIDCYYDLIERIIYPADSHGKLGGKSSGLFLATQILKEAEANPLLGAIKTPKTWYITSDGMIDFVHYNNLEGVMEQKYKERDEIHVEYPNIIQVFKNANFSPEIERGLSMVIEDIGEKPIIVRSSSLLEDSMKAAFSGKYKSLFLANRGSKSERLKALCDAVAEVYSSIFAPDPIEYRKEKGLLDCNEEMGIMIQEVVGNQVGNYFFPSFAGVAFSENEFRWSSRIERDDGLIRLVPGLGTRAVDRLADDYPILISPGKPNLLVNITPEEVIRYSPKYMDVINLDTNTFETIKIEDLFYKLGSAVPGIQNMISIYTENMIQAPGSILNLDFRKKNAVVTFEGLIRRTDFMDQIKETLMLLKSKIGKPIDIEFAHDGSDLYILQCRPQSYSRDNLPAPIPQNINMEKLVFSANKYITNGVVQDITHVVYVEPEGYYGLSDLASMKRVGRVVSKLNKILPKRQFILMGPGRWGSRGDIKLGINVTYADINNTAVLIEMANKKGNYTPDLSFGTHFFQDLVEASIKYLPLYPDNEDNVFKESFFHSSDNILSEILPDYAQLADIIKVIDIPKTYDGSILRVLMNADLNKAIAFLSKPQDTEDNIQDYNELYPSETKKEFWRWRYNMAERIASHLDGRRFGVEAFYVFGSTKNASAGSSSDIDILIHFRGTEKQKQDLLLWLEGWSLTLSEINFLRTGYKTDGFLDIHIVTDNDITNKTSYALKINAVTDAAHELPLKESMS